MDSMLYNVSISALDPPEISSMPDKVSGWKPILAANDFGEILGIVIQYSCFTSSQ